MAGSRSWFKYVADDATEYNVQIDDTNATAAGFAAADDASDPKLPIGMNMRYVNLIEPTTGARRTLQVASVAGDLWTGVANTVQLWNQGQGTPGLATFHVTSRISERRRNLPILTDTGLTI